MKYFRTPECLLMRRVLLHFFGPMQATLTPILKHTSPSVTSTSACATRHDNERSVSYLPIIISIAFSAVSCIPKKTDTSCCWLLLQCRCKYFRATLTYRSVAREQRALFKWVLKLRLLCVLSVKLVNGSQEGFVWSNQRNEGVSSE